MGKYVRSINWKVASTIAGYKLLTLFIIFFAFSLLPFAKIPYEFNFVYPTRQNISLQTAYKTWDGFHYLYLSEKGYHPNDPSDAFAPLFPFTIHLLTFLTHNSFWSGILLSNIFSFVAFYLFYLLVCRIKNKEVAYKSLIFFLAFPTTFFTSLIYSESLFLLLVMLSWYLLYQNKILFASVVSFFVPFARLIGIAIFLPLLSVYLFDMKKLTRFSQVTEILSFIKGKALTLFFAPLIGFLVLLLFMNFATGNPFAQFAALTEYVSHHSVFEGLNILFQLKQFFQFPLALHGFTNSVLDRTFFIAFLCYLPLIYRYTPRGFFVYAVVFGLVPVLSGSYMSYMRYLMVVFPIFLTLTEVFQRKKYAFLEMPTLFFFLMLQTLFLIMHSLNYWVG